MAIDSANMANASRREEPEGAVGGIGGRNYRTADRHRRMTARGGHHN
jgi:hypothetical protein